MSSNMQQQMIITDAEKKALYKAKNNNSRLTIFIDFTEEGEPIYIGITRLSAVESFNIAQCDLMLRQVIDQVMQSIQEV